MESKPNPQFINKPLRDTRIETAETRCKEYVKKLKELYESRIIFVEEYLSRTIKNMKEDFVLITMGEDPSLNEFVISRIEEILSDATAAEREIQVHRLMQELAINRSEQITTENKIQKLSGKVLQLEQEGNNMAKKWEAILNELRSKEEENNQLVKQLYDLNNSAEQTLKEKMKENEHELKKKDDCIKTLKEQMEELKKNFESTYTELEVLKLEKSTQDTQLEQSVQGIKELLIENEDLRSKLKEAGEQILISKEELAQIKVQAERLHEMINSNENELKATEQSLQKEINDKLAIEVKYKEDIEKYKDLLDAEQEKYEIITDELHKENLDYKAQLDQLQSNFNDLKAEHDKLKRNLDDAKTINKALKEREVEKEKEVDNLKKNMNERAIEQEKHIAQLKQSQEQIIEALKDTHNKKLVAS